MVRSEWRIISFTIGQMPAKPFLRVTQHRPGVARHILTPATESRYWPEVMHFDPVRS